MRINAAARQLEPKSTAQGDAVRYEDALRLAALAKAGGDPARQEQAGGPENPLGARALYLGSTLYRIHGSNEPESIGGRVSSGCIRMTNEDVIDLYGRVPVGAKVVVL